MDLISIIIPCYNEEKCIPIFYERICEVMNSIKNTVCELIFVDDGSTDNTINVIKELHQKDLRINYLSFSRNFGKESAMLAGFKKSKGDFVAI